jgi:hypothetical protein
MDIAQIAWRDVVLLIAVAAGIYLAFSLLRLLQVGQRRHRKPVMDTSSFPAAEDTSVTKSEVGTEELPFQFPLTPLTVHSPVPGYQTQAREAEAASPAPSFAETLSNSRVEQEVRELRVELAALREELADMQASRRVSPQYADAMALARRGFDAQGIADHCGIARGEAELVLSLANGVYGQQGSNEGEDEHVGTEQRDTVAGR